MPKRTDIKKILVIGSGPIIIGQAAEFDYAGSQACQPRLHALCDGCCGERRDHHDGSRHSRTGAVFRHRRAACARRKRFSGWLRLRLLRRLLWPDRQKCGSVHRQARFFRVRGGDSCVSRKALRTVH